MNKDEIRLNEIVGYQRIGTIIDNNNRNYYMILPAVERALTRAG